MSNGKDQELEASVCVHQLTTTLCVHVHCYGCLSPWTESPRYSSRGIDPLKATLYTRACYTPKPCLGPFRGGLPFLFPIRLSLSTLLGPACGTAHRVSYAPEFCTLSGKSSRHTVTHDRTEDRHSSHSTANRMCRDRSASAILCRPLCSGCTQACCCAHHP